MQRHLDPLVRVLVVHVVHAVQRVDVGLGQPVHHRVEAGVHVGVVEHVAGDGPDRRCDLDPGDLVPAAVDRVQQRLGQVHPGAEELHLLADRHRRHAAGDRRVVAALLGDQGVRLVLDGGGVDGHLRTEPLEPLGQPVTPEHGQVRLGCRAQVVEGLQHPQRRPGDQGPAVARPSRRSTRSPRSGRRRTGRRTRGCAGTGRSGA